MKKIFLICLILAIIPIDSISGSITISSPTSQTEWGWKTDQKIGWNTTDVSKRMKITLWKANKYIRIITLNFKGLYATRQVPSNNITHQILELY